mgnify:FL=1
MSGVSVDDPRSVVPARHLLVTQPPPQLVSNVPVTRVRITTEVGTGDIDPWSPIPDGIHLCVPTAARAWKITEAVLASYNLQIGEGIQFWIQNNSGGAFAITLTSSGSPYVTGGAGTFTIAQANTRHFILTRTSATVHTLTTTGTLAH